MSGLAITQDLMERLKRHYIKPGQGFKGGVFVPECGTNGMASLSRCDALYVGFTSTSGRMLLGHEVKASRSDWLHELDQLDKATVWADQCHEWWLVTAPGVVHEGELPADWGHMEPGRRDVQHKVRWGGLSETADDLREQAKLLDALDKNLQVLDEVADGA